MQVNQNKTTTDVVLAQQATTDVAIPNANAVYKELQERSNQIAYAKEDANPVVAFNQVGDELKDLITKFLPSFKLKDQEKEIEDELKRLFQLISKLIG